MKSVPASSQKSNIRKAAGYLPGTFKPQAVEIPKMEGLNPFPSKTFEDQAKEVISQTDLRDRNKLVSSAITEDQSYKRWIEGINSDDRVSPGVKRELTEWYRKNFRDTDNPASDIRIPSSAKEYLDKNKQEVERSVYVQGSPMFGGGTYQKGIVKENTPEQMAEIADFLVNSPKGRAVVEEERMFLEKLDQDIDELESKMLESAKRREEMRPKSGSLKEILMRPK